MKAQQIADTITDLGILKSNLKSLNGGKASISELLEGDYIVDWDGIEADLFIQAPAVAQTADQIIDDAYSILNRRLAKLI